MACYVVFVLFFVANIVSLSRGQTTPHLTLQADPQVIIPGLTQTLTLTCAPGRVAAQFREIFLMQILATLGDTRRSLVTLQPGQSPKVTSPDPRVKVSGSLSMLDPHTAILKLFVDRPTALDAGKVECEVVGMGKDGNVLAQTQTLIISEHPEAGLVDQTLKEMVAELKREADGLVGQTLTLRTNNQRLAHLHAQREAAVQHMQSEVQRMKARKQSLQRTVESLERSLTDTAQNLSADIAQVASHAPAKRVAFNAQQTTERIYGGETQILFNTVEMNEGQGYNSSTSTFRVPTEGLYYITSSQLAHDLSANAGRTFAIKRNSTILAGATNSDDRQSSFYKQSSMSALYHLGPYDLITIYQMYSTSSASALTPYSDTPGGRSTSFVGYLVV